MIDNRSVDDKLVLKAGDWVVVRSSREILATLDANARLEQLPFMPQMLQHCGKTFQVRKRAHKLCDSVFNTGGRELNDAVFLHDSPCDGSAFGGCEMRCTIIWKEAWLKRADVNRREAPSPPEERLDALVWAGTKKDTLVNCSSDPTYVCQATQLPSATKLLPWWKLGQYIEDYRSGNAALADIVSRLAFLLYAGIAESGVGLGFAFRGIYNMVQAARGGQPYPLKPGHLPAGGRTPSINLGLKVGDFVRVKSGDEILATVDEFLSNKGMGFSHEMMAYCGKTFRISQRLQRVIDEKTGKLRELKTACLVLEGADCKGSCTRPLNCPRACPPYWREIWLEPVNEGVATRQYGSSLPAAERQIERVL